MTIHHDLKYCQIPICIAYTNMADTYETYRHCRYNRDGADHIATFNTKNLQSKPILRFQTLEYKVLNSNFDT